MGTGAAPSSHSGRGIAIAGGEASAVARHNTASTPDAITNSQHVLGDAVAWRWAARRRVGCSPGTAVGVLIIPLRTATANVRGQYVQKQYPRERYVRGQYVQERNRRERYVQERHVRERNVRSRHVRNLGACNGLPAGRLRVGRLRVGRLRPSRLRAGWLRDGRRGLAQHAAHGARREEPFARSSVQSRAAPRGATPVPMATGCPGEPGSRMAGAGASRPYNPTSGPRRGGCCPAQGARSWIVATVWRAMAFWF